jgi:multidrug resistance efflux pump
MVSGQHRAPTVFFRRHGGPIVVWVCAVTVVAFLLTSRTTVIEAPGLVQGRSIRVSPIEPGLLASIEVALLQEVRRGQVVARMDGTRLHAEAAMVAAEVEAVRRELELERAERDQNTVSDQRRFQNDVETCRLAVLEILTVLEPDRVTLADRRRDVASYRELLDRELVSVREFQRVQAECDALDRRVAEHETLLARARDDLAEAERRRDAFFAANEDVEGNTIQVAAERALSARITALEKQLQAVRVRHDDLALTAPFDGYVTQIQASPGQLVQSGDIVLTLTDAHPQQIVVWLDEAAVRRLQQRDDLAATVVQNGFDGSVQARCPVAHIGVSVEDMPQELWQAPDRIQRGRPVILGLPPDLNLVPGERVTVRWS